MKLVGEGFGVGFETGKEVFADVELGGHGGGDGFL